MLYVDVSDSHLLMIYMITTLRSLRKFGRFFGSQKESKAAHELQKVVLFPGNGIGPEISQSVVEIFNQLQVPIEFEYHEIHTSGQTKHGDLISEASLDALRKYKVGLKGPFETPIGKGFRSLNVTLRKRLKLYANVRPCKSIDGVDTPYKNVDVVTIRENTEGEYSGLEHEVVPGVVENLKIISRTACEDIANYAFEYARRYSTILLNQTAKTCWPATKQE